MEPAPHSDTEPFFAVRTAAASSRLLITVSFALFVLVCPGAFALAHSSQRAGPAEHDALLSTLLAQKNEQWQSVGNFIAAFELDAQASSGSSANKWGLWVGDPGADARTAIELKSNAPSWYQPLDWFKEEHGLIMPNPVALPAGRYKVYGDITTGGPKLLTVEANGSWSLQQGVTIDQVTHHPCKAFRYLGGQSSGCAADNEAACTEHGSPVEYKVLIVDSQTVAAIPGGSLPLP